MPLSEDAAAWAWLGLKLVVLVVTAVSFARPWTGDRRILAALAVVAFPPVVHDLVIGNVSTVTLLVLLAVARWEGLRAGALLGLVILLMPKPHLLPILVYLAFARRREFGGAMITILARVILGLAMFGTEPWLAFVETLREPLERTFTANIGFSGLLGPVGVVIGLGLVAAILRGGGDGRRESAATASASWPASSQVPTRSSTTWPGRSWLPSQPPCVRDRAGSHRFHGSWSYFPSFRSGWLGLPG